MKIIDINPKTISKFNSDYFNQLEKKSFLRIYSPFCHHCENMAGDWKSIESFYKKKDNQKNGNLISIHSEVLPNLNKSFEVDGYPLLITMINGKKDKEYLGDRTYLDLKKFIDQHFQSIKNGGTKKNNKNNKKNKKKSKNNSIKKGKYRKIGKKTFKRS